MGLVKMAADIIWFNQWFSSIYHTIRQIKQDFDAEIIGTSANADHTYRVAVDRFFTEPTFEHSDDYVNWALAFCKEHGVTVFFPKAFNSKISEQKQRFHQIGVTVVIEDYAVKPIPLHERMALYAGAEMNFGVGNGPLTMLALTPYPMMMFASGTDPGRRTRFGLLPGERIPWMGERQHLIWDNDDLGKLRREFEKVSTINGH